MSIKSIVTFVPPHEAAGANAALEKALALGAEMSAHVVVLTYPIDVLAPESDEASDAATLAAARTAILRRAEAAGVVATIVDRTSHAYGIGEVLADQLKVADLGILRGDARPLSGQRMLIGSALFESGRPVILMPRTAPDRLPGRIVVAWDGSPAAARAMHEAMPLMKLASEVVVARVSETDAPRHGQSGIEAAHHLARHGYRASFREIDRADRDIFTTLTDTVRETGAGLLVCGAVRHSAVHDLVFGSVTQRVLAAECEVPVLLST